MWQCIRRSLALVGWLAVASLWGADHVFPVTGTVRSRLKEGRIVVSHEEIVGFMPAMTMGFTVAPAATAAAGRLQVGDRVAFVLQVDEERSFADGFKIVGQPTSAASPQAGDATPSSRRIEPGAAATIERVQAGDAVPAFQLVDEQDRPLTAATLAGHATVLTFIFTRCPVPEYCPLMARRFAELQRAIESDPALRGRAELLSITLDPEFDRPPVLKAYGEAVGAHAATWHFATGTPAEATALARAFSVYTERNGAVLDHTLCTALIDASGHIVELWRGNGWKTPEVLAALRAAGVRSSRV